SAAEGATDAGAAAAGPTARKDAIAVAAAIATPRRAIRSRPRARWGLLAFIRLAPRSRAIAPASVSLPVLRLGTETRLTPRTPATAPTSYVQFGPLRRYLVYWTPYCHARLPSGQAFLPAFLAPLFGWLGATVPAVLGQQMNR